MKAHKAYYSLIQYCPDRGRAEVANVGVLVLCPALQFVDARTSTNNQRVTGVFGRGTFDSSWLNAVKRSFVDAVRKQSDRMRSLDDVEALAGRLANDLILTAPRVMRSEKPAADLKALFSEYVQRFAPRRPEPIPNSVRSLDQVFRQLEGKRKSVRVGCTFDVPSYPHKVHADYAYNNSHTNLVRLLRIGRSPAQAFATAVHLGGESIYVDKHLKVQNHSAKLVVVAAPENASIAKSTEPQLAKLFRDYRTANLIRSAKVPEFAERVEKEAH